MLKNNSLAPTVECVASGLAKELDQERRTAVDGLGGRVTARRAVDQAEQFDGAHLIEVPSGRSGP